MTIIAPIHTGDINGKPIRFFKAPLPIPHLPWHCHDDLLRALGLPRSLRRHLQQSMQKCFGADIKTVATAEGILTIAPHFAAQGLLGAAADTGMVSANIEHSYVREAAAALKALGGDLPPAARVEFCLMAARNTLNGGAA
jgi:hypothetical protein